MYTETEHITRHEADRRTHRVAIRTALLVFPSVAVVTMLLLLWQSQDVAEVLYASLLSALNLLAWEFFALAFLIQSKIKLLHFLVGTSFKTFVILLLVHPLRSLGEGYLFLQLVSLVGSLLLLAMVMLVARKWLA